MTSYGDRNPRFLSMYGVTEPQQFKAKTSHFTGHFIVCSKANQPGNKDAIKVVFYRPFYFYLCRDPPAATRASKCGFFFVMISSCNDHSVPQWRRHQKSITKCLTLYIFSIMSADDFGHKSIKITKAFEWIGERWCISEHLEEFRIISTSITLHFRKYHGDVIKWKHFPRYWPFGRGIHRGPGTPSFDAFFDLRLSKRLSKQSWGWWFETLSRPLWRQCNDLGMPHHLLYSTCFKKDCFIMTWLYINKLYVLNFS